MRRMRASFSFPLAVLALSGSVAMACSSEPLSSAGSAGSGGSDVGGSSGQVGRGGAGAVGGRAEQPPAPDYTTSPCYGQPGATQVYDGKTHEVGEVSATCRGEGTRARVYVADSLFGMRVTQEAVNEFLQRYELIGNPKSFRPELGVLPTDEAVFGELTGAGLVDGKFSIFVIDTRGAGEGYLCSWCEDTQLHLDGTLLASLAGDPALSIAAHESYHAIHRGYDADETIWVDESMAEAAMTVNGYFTDQRWLADFLRRPNVSWGPAVDDIADFHYGAGLLFGTYLWEQGGPELMHAVTIERSNGWAGLDASLAAIGQSKSAFELFLDMAVALYFDDPERGYGFRSFDFDEPLATRELAVDGRDSGSLQPYGLVYETLAPTVGTIRVDADAVDARLAFAGKPIRVIPVELGVDTPVESSPSVLVLTAKKASSYDVSAR